MASLVCVACGATTVDPRAAAQAGSAKGDPTAPPIRPGTPLPSQGLPNDLTLEEPVLSLEGLAALGEAGFESELEHLRSQRRRQLGILVLMVLAGLSFVVLVPILIVSVGAVRMLLEPQVVDVPELPGVEQPAVVEPMPAEPEPEGPGDDPEPTEGTDAAPEEAPEAPEPAAAPAPQPVDPVQAFIQRGWKVASREPAAGAEAFRKALELSPRHSEANYGLGYCLLKQGDLDGAQQHLCVARSTSKSDIRRDVDALLANNGLACSD